MIHRKTRWGPFYRIIKSRIYTRTNFFIKKKSEDNKIVNKIAEFYDTEVDFLKSMMFLHWVLIQFINDTDYLPNELKNHKELKNILRSLIEVINKLISMIFNNDTSKYTFFTINH